MYEYKKCCLTCAELAYICGCCSCLAHCKDFQTRKISLFFCDEYNISYSDYFFLRSELTQEQKKYADRKFDDFDFNTYLEFIIKTVEDNHKAKENEQ